MTAITRRNARHTGLTMMEVVEAVARASGLDCKDLLGRRRTRPLARARHLAMYLVREMCPGASLPAIGYLLDRDHTTVLHGCRRAAALLECDVAFCRLRAVSYDWLLCGDPAKQPPKVRDLERLVGVS